MKEEKRNWKAEVISFCVYVHVGTWHAQIYIQANELLGSFTLTGTRKKKLSLRIKLEKSLVEQGEKQEG